MARMYTVMCKRTVTQRVTVKVFADDAAEAINSVERGDVPVQWPDGEYLSERDHAVVTAHMFEGITG